MNDILKQALFHVWLIFQKTFKCRRSVKRLLFDIFLEDQTKFGSLFYTSHMLMWLMVTCILQCTFFLMRHSLWIQFERLLAVDPIAKLTSRATRYYTWYSFEYLQLQSPLPLPFQFQLPLPPLPPQVEDLDSTGGRYSQRKLERLLMKYTFLIFQQTTNYEIPSFTVDNKERLLTSDKDEKTAISKGPLGIRCIGEKQRKNIFIYMNDPS